MSGEGLSKVSDCVTLKKYPFGILGVGVFYIGEPDKYRFSKKQKMALG
jgi:hypothetical protein